MSALWEQSAYSTSVVNIMAGSKATNGNGPLGMRDKRKITQENRLVFSPIQYLWRTLSKDIKAAVKSKKKNSQPPIHFDERKTQANSMGFL